MLNLQIKENEVRASIEGTTAEIIAECSLLMYSIYTQCIEETGMPLEDYLKILTEAVTDIPDHFEVKNAKKNSTEIYDATGVEQ